MIDFALLLVLMLGASWFGGWWGILLVAAGWGWWWRSRKPAWRAGLAAAIAWGVWLALVGSPYTMVALLEKLSEIIGAPSPLLLALPSIYAGLLGWSAGRLVQGFRPVGE